MWTFSTQTSIYEGDWLKSPEINNTKQAGTVPGTQWVPITQQLLLLLLLIIILLTHHPTHFLRNFHTYLFPWSDRYPPNAMGIRRVAIWKTRCGKVSRCVLQGLPTCCTSKTTTVIRAHAHTPHLRALCTGLLSKYTLLPVKGLRTHWWKCIRQTDVFLADESENRVWAPKRNTLEVLLRISGLSMTQSWV